MTSIDRPPFEQDPLLDLLAQTDFIQTYYELCTTYKLPVNPGQAPNLNKATVLAAWRSCGIEPKYIGDKGYTYEQMVPGGTLCLSSFHTQSTLTLALNYQTEQFVSGGDLAVQAAKLLDKQYKPLMDPPYPRPVVTNEPDTAAIVHYGLDLQAKLVALLTAK